MGRGILGLKRENSCCGILVKAEGFWSLHFVVRIWGSQQPAVSQIPVASAPCGRPGIAVGHQSLTSSQLVVGSLCLSHDELDDKLQMVERIARSHSQKQPKENLSRTHCLCIEVAWQTQGTSRVTKKEILSPRSCTAGI